MSSSLIQCPKCRTSLMEWGFNQQATTPCPACAIPLQIEIFPAFFRRIAAGRDGEILMVEGESSCFYHPNKKAVLPCQGCGRFLCALCDCELHGEHFCTTCLEAGKTKGRIKNLEDRRTLYDSIALALAIAPMLIFYFTFVTAPAALFISLRYWNAPRSVVHRTKFRYILAIIIATIQIVGWAVAIYFLTTRRSHG